MRNYTVTESMIKAVKKIGHPAIQLRNFQGGDYTDTQFLYMYYLTIFMAAKDKMKLPLSVVMMHYLPHSDVQTLMQEYRDQRFIDDEDNFTVLAQEYNLGCFFKRGTYAD